MWLIKNIDQFGIVVDDDDIEIAGETPVSLLIDGKKKTGFYVLNEALNQGISKAKKSGIVAVGLTNTSATTGYMTQYARKATDAELMVFLFTNSPSRLVPFDTRQKLWGTNPVTVGIPTGDSPIILDMATSKITFGDLMNAFNNNTPLPKSVAIDADGNMTIDASKAKDGGLLPIADHKGSGLGFIVEILSGALTGSMMGQTIPGGWGTFAILIDPEILRDKQDFYKDIQQSIKELKSLPKAKDNSGGVYYPDEQSEMKRKQSLIAGTIEVGDEVIKKLNELT